jgi:hypothetical protein
MSEQTYTEDTSQVLSVWSTYGHRFLSDGGENTESCLTCGAMYQLLALEDDPTRGEYLTAGGDEPAECTRDTSMDHGYDAETDCPCIACDS